MACRCGIEDRGGISGCRGPQRRDARKQYRGRREAGPYENALQRPFLL
jgi:hypothetical protein